MLKSRKEHKKYEGYNYTNRDWCAWYTHQSIIKGTGRFGGRSTGRDHPNYTITESGQNTEKNPAELRRLTVTHTPVKNQQLKLI